MKKRIISILLIFTICFSFSVPYVSAYSIIENPLTDNIYVDSSSNVSQDLLEKIYRAFAKNPHLSDLGIESGSDFICLVYKYPNQDMGSIQISSANVVFHCDYADVFSSNSSTIVYSNFSTSISESNLSNFESMNFSVSNVDFSQSSVTTVIRNTAYNNRFCVATVSFLTNYVSSPQYNRMYSYAYGLSIPFSPSYEEVPLPFYSLDVDSFYDWIINNNKLSELPSYIVQSKLKSFLEFYKQFGSSNSFFVSRISDWFSHMNIVNQSLSNIQSLKYSIDKLYQEYINYRSGTHAYWPGATKIQERDNIDTQTDNNNTILITDDSNDSLDISILRDILRGVIAISNNIIDGCGKIVSAINQLDFIVNLSNDGGIAFDFNSIWGTGDITQSENYLALTSAFMDKGVDVSAAENMKINYLDNASQLDSFTVSVVMPDQYINGAFTEKTVTHTIDNTSKMYNTLLLFRKLIAFAVIAYFAIRIRFELPHLIRGE